MQTTDSAWCYFGFFEAFLERVPTEVDDLVLGGLRVFQIFHGVREFSLILPELFSVFLLLLLCIPRARGVLQRVLKHAAELGVQPRGFLQEYPLLQC